MFMVLPMAWHTGSPVIAWSVPSMVSLVPPGDAAALDDADAEELALLARRTA
jgi:hypothetical protein